MRLILAVGFAVAALLCWSTAASAADLTGRASIIDGDTLEIQDQRIRLFGIDAPEAPRTCTASGRIKPLLVMLEAELVYRERHPKDGRECQ